MQALIPSDLESLHNVHHQVHLIREALQSEKRRLGFFLGAGCPLGIYDKDGEESLKHIPDVAGLTSAVGTDLDEASHFKDSWTKLTSACKTDKVPIPNVEHILTQLRTICALKGTTQVDGMTSDGLRKLDTKICGLIAKTVGKGLPEHTNSYHRFAAWISHIDRVSPVEVFTPSYDLLLEEALEQYKVPSLTGLSAHVSRSSTLQRWNRTQYRPDGRGSGSCTAPSTGSNGKMDQFSVVLTRPVPKRANNFSSTPRTSSTIRADGCRTWR